MFYNYIVLPSGRSLLFNAAIMFNADHSIVHQQSNPRKHLKKFNDVVEIFHNTKLKKSEVSSKHSKVDGAKYEKKPQLPETKEAPRKIQEASMLSPRSKCPERVNHECQSHDKKNDCKSHDKRNEKDQCRSHDKKNQQDLQTLNNQNNSE